MTAHRRAVTWPDEVASRSRYVAALLGRHHQTAAAHFGLEDLTQDVLLRALKAGPPTDPAAIPGYLRVIAGRVVADAYRFESRRPETVELVLDADWREDGAEVTEGAWTLDEYRSDTLAALGGLCDEYRVVLVAVAAGLTGPEIAAQTGAPTWNAVSKRKQRARQELRGVMAA